MTIATETRTVIARLDVTRVDEAAGLWSARLDELRSDVPCLGSIPIDSIAASIRGLLDRAPGWAAFSADRLVGYLAGVGVEGVRGPGMAAFVPEWGWAVERGTHPSALSDLYAVAAAEWVRRGWFRHVIGSIPVDIALDRELGWLGFAPCVVDAIRDRSVGVDTTAAAGFTFERARDADLDVLAELDRTLEDHLRASPMFLDRDEDVTREVAGWLSDPDRTVWLARTGGRAISFVCLSREAGGVARNVGDPRIVHVVAACTHPDFRSRGIAEGLLAMGLDGARGDGFAAAAVDFETANPPARRFWPRFFSPVCVSYERNVDPRLGRADGVR